LLHDPPKAEVMMAREGRIALDNSLIKVKFEADKLTPRGSTSELAGSLNTEVRERKQFRQGVVFYGVRYALPVEFGRRAAPVSRTGQQSIRRWVEKSSAGTSLWNALKSRYPKITSKQVAFLVARKKKLKRTKGQKFFRKAVNISESYVKAQFEKLGVRVGKKLMEVT